MFYVFSIWDGNKCLSWEQTEIWCNLLELKIVPVIYEGIYDQKSILDSFAEYGKSEPTEGFVIRLKEEFSIENFENSLSKYVKKSFILPSDHWRYSKKIINKLKNGKSPWEII